MRSSPLSKWSTPYCWEPNKAKDKRVRNSQLQFQTTPWDHNMIPIQKLNICYEISYSNRIRHRVSHRARRTSVLFADSVTYREGLQQCDHCKTCQLGLEGSRCHSAANWPSQESWCSCCSPRPQGNPQKWRPRWVATTSVRPARKQLRWRSFQ